MPWVYQISCNEERKNWDSFPMLIGHEEIKEIMDKGLCCDEREFMDRKKANYHIATSFESNELYSKIIRYRHYNFSYCSKNEMTWLKKRFDEIMKEITEAMKCLVN